MSHQQRVASPPNNAPSISLPVPRGLMLAWLVALLVARWLIPTEGAAEGLTLWLVQLVLLTAVTRTIWVWRFEDRPVQFDAIDVAIAALILAQVVSALNVVIGVGNSRAAINLAWEWVGSGVLIWLLRQELRGARAVMPLCLGLSLMAGVLAGYGLWQHYVWYDQMARDYVRLTTEHDRLSQTPTDARRLQSLRKEMAQQGIPIDPAARKSLDDRLKASREPFGLFALANTFAGLLAAMLLILLGTLSGFSFRNGTLGTPLGSRLVAMALALVIAFCLLLTKSRTAWVGLSAGLGWWALRMMSARWQRKSESASGSRLSLGVWVILAGSILVGIAGVATLSGGLDRAVFAEAPKSLRYRLEYWQGTWATIREHFWLGTGPGNFRDYYLAHKLPESSEEIADPHNFILDVWSNAGALGLIGLAACLGLMARQVVASGSRPHAGLHEVESMSSGVWGVGLAFPLSAVGMEFMGHGNDERLWWLGAIWWGVWFGRVICSKALPASVRQFSSSGLPVALEAANVALLVHLMGAGGIAMPAITQLLWLVWILRAACSEPIEEGRDEKSPSELASAGVNAGRLPVGVMTLVSGGLCVLCWWTATMPELLCRASLQMGDAEWGRGQAAAARERYLDASRADSYAIEPLERLADLSFQIWQSTHADHEFEESVKRWQVISTRLPFSSRPFRRLGQAWLAKFERSGDAQDGTRAVEAYAAAVERYPNHAMLLSEWATACDRSALIEPAREAARRAIRQDNLNRQAGHSDKYLGDPTRRRMERLAAEQTEPN